MAQNLEKEILSPTEQVIANFRELRVNNQPGFSATVTNYRLLFFQKSFIHDIQLDAIVALSWRRLGWPLRERLDIYTTGGKTFSVSGSGEALFELYRAIRQQGG